MYKLTCLLKKKKKSQGNTTPKSPPVSTPLIHSFYNHKIVTFNSSGVIKTMFSNL
jgi:hypothetical protein